MIQRTKTMKQINNQFNISDELEWLTYNRKTTHEKIVTSQKKMKATYQSLVHGDSMPANKLGKAIYFLDKGATVIQGLRAGYKVAELLTAVLAFKRIFKR